MRNFIGITVGDIKGIGIYILLKNWKKNKLKNIILFSNINIIKKYLKKNNLKIRINLINFEVNNYNTECLNIYSYSCNNLEENTYKSLQIAYKFCIKKKCIGVITLPLRKDLIKRNIDKKFIGHTEFFQKLDKKKYSNMILYHEKIIISPLTTHVPINKLCKLISNKKYIVNQLLNLNNSLKKDFNFKKPKIILSGLNPHAGENGEIGKEEIDFIIPAVNELKNKGVSIIGPLSGDSILIKKNLKQYDCFVFLFHDQALIPFKFISQFSGINYTGNLNIIRTSPDHGTAYELVGSNKLCDKSLINCYKLIKKIYRNRNINDKC